MTDAHAQDREDAGQWRFQVTPYVWMIGLKGDIRPLANGPRVDVDKSFSELVKHLDAAAFLTGTARRDRWVLQADVSHTVTTDKEDLPFGLTAKARVKQNATTLSAGYALRDDPEVGVDVMAGVRFWNITTQVAVPLVGEARVSKDFVDPIVALRWRQAYSSRWSSLFYTDAGGWGAGSQSTWQMVAAANYKLSDQWFFSLGYRTQHLNYNKHGTRLKLSFNGPIIGATYLFGAGRPSAPL